MNYDIDNFERIQAKADRELTAGNMNAAFSLLRENQPAFDGAASALPPEQTLPIDPARLKLAREILPMLELRNFRSTLFGDGQPPVEIAEWLDAHADKPLSPRIVRELEELLEDSARHAAQLGERLTTLAGEAAVLDARVALWSRFVLYFRLAMLAEEKDPATFDETLAGLVADEFSALRIALPEAGREERWLKWERRFRELIESIKPPIESTP